MGAFILVLQTKILTKTESDADKCCGKSLQGKGVREYVSV